MTIIDEYCRFPFAFACADIESSIVIKCFNQLFSIFGMPVYIHSDRAPNLISKEIKDYHFSKGIATSRTSLYNPKGNRKVERYNGIIWNAIQLDLKTRGLDTSQLEAVLLDALHSVRSLLCTATNCTPHERRFSYQRRSASGNSISTCLITQEKVLLKRHVRKAHWLMKSI